MKNLLFSSLWITAIFLTASCSYSHQSDSETVSQESQTIEVPDSNTMQRADTVVADSVQQEPIQAYMGEGDTISARSTRTESTEPGTTAKHPGAVRNPGANQTQTDSIKKSKTKGKKPE